MRIKLEKFIEGFSGVWANLNAKQRETFAYDLLNAMASMPGGKGFEFEVPDFNTDPNSMTRQQIADLYGIHYATVVQNLSKLKECGRLRTQGGKTLYTKESVEELANSRGWRPTLITSSIETQAAKTFGGK